MPIWLDLKQQHGRLTATTGSRHLLATRPLCTFFFPGRNCESGSPGEGFLGFAFGGELLARNVASAAIGSILRRRRSSLSSPRPPAAARRFLEGSTFSRQTIVWRGGQEEKRGRPWRVSGDPRTSKNIRDQKARGSEKKRKEKKRSTARAERQ